MADRTPRRKQRLAAGLLLILGVVAFFTYIGIRDSKTLREGDRFPGVVVGKIEPSAWEAWDFFAFGKLRVSWESDLGTRTTDIRIDNELDDYDVGQSLTVYVRGDHVRTEREPNDPTALGTLAMAVGLVGLGLVGWGVTPERATRISTTGTGATRIPLVVWRLSPRKAHLDVSPMAVSLYLPSFFGARCLEAPLSGLAFTLQLPDEDDEEDDDLLDDESEDDVYFRDGLTFADFPTASTLRPPNLLLLFRRPLRVPPLRWYHALSNGELPFGVISTRRKTGDWIDAATIRTSEPHAAAEVLRGAGVEEVDLPIDWLARHREVVTDPVEQEALDLEEAASLRWVNLEIGCLMAGGLLAGAAKLLGKDLLLAPSLGLLALGAVIVPAARSLLSRRRKLDG